jgi:predicted metalloprotease
MRWRGRRQSDNVEDRRGMSPQAALGGGGGAILLIGIVIAGRFMGCDAGQIQQAVNVAIQAQQQQAAPAELPEGTEAGIDDEASQFIKVVLADTEAVWSKLFREQRNGADYPEPALILFQGSVATGGCGMGSESMGPFYCPGDQKVYVPPSFFDDLARRHNAPGDFAQAYVIAHEVAHHVQNVLGLNQELQQIRRSGDKRAINRQSVRLELQADYLAGVWAHHAHRQFDLLEDGDIEEAINAAKQIGDDTLQMQAQGRTVPDHYTHGTSAQRMRWFRRGMQTGDLQQCLLLAQLPYEEL